MRKLKEVLKHQRNHVYLILDGNQIDGLESEIEKRAVELEAASIYKGTDLDALNMVSPWIVAVPSSLDSPLIDWVAEKQYAARAAWFFSSHHVLDDVVQHFQSLLFVKHPLGHEVVFRLQDPRVAYALLLSHSGEELNDIAGPLCHAWFLKYGDWQTLTLPVWQGTARHASSPPYELTDKDIAVLSNVSMVQFISQLDEHIKTFFPRWYNNPNKLFSADIVQQAKKMGFVSERSIYFYTNVLGYLGEGILDDNHYLDIQQLLTQPSLLTPEQRVEKAAERAYDYFQGVNDGHC